MRCAKDFRKICNEKIAPEKKPALKEKKMLQTECFP